MGERIQKKFEEHDSEIRELKRVVRGLQEALLRKGGGEGADDDASNTRGTPREDKEDKRSEPETKNKVILSTSTAALLETFASLASAQPAMTSSPSSASATSSAAALLSAPLQKLEAKQPAKEVETGGKATMDIGMTSFPSGHRNFELNPSNLPHWLDRNQASHAPTVSKKQSFNSLHSLKVKYTSNGLHNPPLSHLSHPSGGGSGAQPSAATSGVKRPATTSPPHEEAESGAGGSSSADDGRIHAGGSSKTIRRQLSKDEALIDAI